MDLNKVKLVIWDLDNTFWSGTISEQEVQSIPRNIELVKSLTDCGIINSICSKNTFEIAAGKLVEFGVLDYFVFPSIEWTSKGQRLRDLINDMALRAENVLFIDDEITNLEEAKHYSPEIMVAGPDIISALLEFIAVFDKKDLNHTRLKQYKLLEEKRIEQKKYDNNEEFLFASNIRAGIVENCIPEMERIHDLISRSNQLNYTKKRISKDELKSLLENREARCGYVSVNDKFGDYGIVGFYAILNNKLEHFLFSCRTLGLGIEQYVYAKLNFPTLEVVGEVVSNVVKADAPLWINNTQTIDVEESVESANLISKHAKFLFKSACDFAQTIAYIKNKELFHSEFNYVNVKRENVIEGHNHSVFLSRLKDVSAAEKQEVLNDCIFYDEAMFKGTIFHKKYDIVFLSTMQEAYAGIYKKKNSNIQVTVGSHLFPITDKAYWPGLIEGKLYSGSNKFTEEYLHEFSEKYEFQGKTTVGDYCTRIEKILNDLDKRTKLCLILGVEFPCEKNTESLYDGRHISHAQLNNAVRELARNNSRIILLDLNRTVRNQNDFTYNINEFSPRINYELSKEIVSIINKSANTKIENKSSLFVMIYMLLKWAKRFVKNLVRYNNTAYLNLQSTYSKLNKKPK